MNSQLHNQNNPFAGATLRKESVDKPLVNGSFIMEKICGIYKITNPKNKIYIGQSVNIRARKSAYKNLLCKDQPRIFNSLSKYGWELHKFEIIHVAEKHELDSLERYYIALYNTFNTEFGLNLKSGGIEGGAYIPTEEVKLKISNSLKGNVPWNKGKRGIYSAEQRMAISNSQKNRIVTDEQKRKTSLSLKGRPSPNKGKVASLETREKMSIKRTGTKQSQETISKRLTTVKNKKNGITT